MNLCTFVTCDGRQRSGVGVGQRHVAFAWIGQVGVTAELLFLGQLEGDRDHKKFCNVASTDSHFSLSLSLPLASHPRSYLPPRDQSHPFAVQRLCPFSFLRDEDHAASLLLLLTLPQLHLCVAHRHHPLPRTHTRAHTAAGARQGGVPGGGRVWRVVPVRGHEGCEV